MVRKIKSKFMPKDYQLTLFRQLHNLRQKRHDSQRVYRGVLQAKYKSWKIEGDVERVARYINGLRYDIQDEISLLNLRTVEDAYQATLKAEEKMIRKQV
jgi:hypothetical protein